jgi:hypothetical protein
LGIGRGLARGRGQVVEQAGFVVIAHAGNGDFELFVEKMALFAQHPSATSCPIVDPASAVARRAPNPSGFELR